MQQERTYRVSTDQTEMDFEVIHSFISNSYLADVFVLESHRGLGLSKLMMAVILEHPDLQGLRRIMLATRDAHGLYAQFGFKAVDTPEMLMQIRPAKPYQ